MQVSKRMCALSGNCYSLITPSLRLQPVRSSSSSKRRQHHIMRNVGMTGYMQRIQECNTGLAELPTLTPFIVNGKVVGQMKQAFIEQLARFEQVFCISASLGPSGSVQLRQNLDTAEKRTEAVAGVLRQLRDERVITGWRDEYYPVTSSFYDQPVMLVERAAATQFGIKAYGVHVNGYVESSDKGLCLWVARRSKSKPTWPGKLDHIAAGGQGYGISVMENVIKECQEEASIPRELAATAVSVGAVSYMNISAAGLKPDVLFVFDIKLPEDFVPKPLDGEVEEFQLLPIQEVARLVSDTTEFKANCNLVIIDFMIRRGCITPDTPGYLQLVASLRQGDCS
ncbi:hypothetical protein CEUSTIGMA_g5389.t1 [Chlamydomonas eustigma]|uniref:Nudix hydrolase domain-containing protein n=1 Tax=Chlamydomonas eustigma TaxID=1157962 RepID=A0A250X4D5_9CHLO|nr:hypothetical protein CEUSTIGMA_g5389.t1 [Chlamydomonas eustigma]|eukprot:GAX77947.1 hypothetical protein CEUSTIGMA_g5389.t1 [Chlamydomonas eustigma]